MRVLLEFRTLYYVKGTLLRAKSYNIESLAVSGVAQDTRQKPHLGQFCVISMKLSLFSRSIQRIYLFVAKDNASVQMEREMKCQLSELSLDYGDSSGASNLRAAAGHMRI